MIAARPPRRFVPADLDPADADRVEALHRSLLERPLDSPAELDAWLRDFSELAAVCGEFESRCYIDKSCHTDDPAAEAAYFHVIEEIEPRIEPLRVALERKLLASPHRAGLRIPGLAVLAERWQAEVDLFRDENVPLETEASKLASDYDKVCGAMTVRFRGQELTLPQVARFVEEPDRETRQEAWEASAERRLADRDRLDRIFDRLVELRQRMARNAGLTDGRAYAWRALQRFDYTPDDCLRFDAAIEAACVPLVAALDRERQDELGLDRLRPWDLDVDPRNRPPLRPFPPDRVGDLIARTGELFHRLSPGLGADFDRLRASGNLDLESRKGKQPGGYQTDLDEVREPFIFMNAAGLQRDVQTLLHEAGHAFHSLAARDEPLVFLRSAPMEFCEVASMAMELLGTRHLDVFYDPADAARARRSMLEGILRFLPWMATVDLFQHWIYTHPEHTREERTREWIRLHRRLGGSVDWSGFEEVEGSLWQRQLHVFHTPFHYVEYGIAQLGALQVWRQAQSDPEEALRLYRAGLALGGRGRLPELFAAAGIRFDFSEQTLTPLVAAVADELGSLPR